MKRKRVNGITLAKPGSAEDVNVPGTRRQSRVPLSITHKRIRGPLGFTRVVKIKPPSPDYTI
jgi:hypothetical protein